jgi:hypothetical protein
MFFRHYLTRVATTSHRKFLTKLIFGEHTFRAYTWRGAISGDKACGVCKTHLETPEHALLQCPAPEDNRIAEVRRVFLQDLDIKYGFRCPAALTDDASLFWLKKMT